MMAVLFSRDKRHGIGDYIEALKPMGKNIYQVIERSKNQTGIALLNALDRIGAKEYSESELVASWLEALHQHRDYYRDGWYMPPPNGIIALFGHAANQYERICQPSFRPQHMWPSFKNCYQKEDIIAVYASPVHRRTNLIGDFGLNLYRGENLEIHEHFEKVLETSLSIARATKVGMAFKDVYSMAMDYGTSQRFQNNIMSSTDKTGTNVGHTIPLSYKSDPTHAYIAPAKTFEEIRKSLSEGRKFLNSTEKQCIEENIAFTIEPRFSTEKMPNTWFHLTVIFENGQQRICHGFSPIFKKFSMNNLLKILTELAP